MQKLFVFDCDGTLINDKREINIKNIEAINHAISLNHKVCLCTGRNFFQLEKYLPLMPGIEIVGSLNGTCIHNTLSHQPIFEPQAISKELINDVIEIAQKMKREVHWTDRQQKMYRVYFGKSPREDITDESFFKVGTINPVYDNWDDVKDKLFNEDVIQISLKIEYSKVLDHYYFLKHKYHDTTKLNDITLSSKVYIDITPFNCNKAEAVKFFQKHYGISNENTYCFGDSDNDITMMDNAINGIVMENGTDLIKYHASWIIGNNNSDTIAETIEAILNNKTPFKQLEPSLLAFDLNNIDQELETIKQQGIECIHYDVMDEYVHNHSFDNEWLAKIDEHHLKTTIHFMVYEPMKWFTRFIEYRPFAITFQYEPLKPTEVMECLNYLKAQYIKAGIAIKPFSQPQDYEQYLKHVDFITIMTVEPGKGGQSLIQEAINNLKFVYDYKVKHQLKYKIQIDGGIKLDNIQTYIDYVDFVVSGTGFMKLDDNERKTFNKIVKGAI